MLRMDRCNIIALFEKLGRFERFAGERQLPYAIGVNFKKFTHIARTVHSCVLCVYQNGTFVCSVRISEQTWIISLYTILYNKELMCA